MKNKLLEEKDNLSKYLEQGLNYTDIAKIFSVHPSTVERACKKLSITSFKVNKYPIDKIKNDLDSGIILEDIALKYKLDLKKLKKTIKLL